MLALLLSAAFAQAPDFDLGTQIPVFDLNGPEEELRFTLNGDAADVFKVRAMPTVKTPFMLAFTREKCPPCLTLKKDAARLNSPHIEFAETPDWAKNKAFPVLYWPTPNSPTGWTMREGYSSLGTLLKDYEDSLKPVAVAPKVRVVQQRAALTCDQYPNNWDWPGDLRQHLSGSPHNFDSNYLNSLSDGQCVALHDQWHEAHRQAEPRQRRGLFGLFRSRS